MIDLHCHILPGVDDGSESLQDSINIARQLKNSGFNSVFATPHVIEGANFIDAKKILNETSQLQKILFQNGIDLKLIPGGEHYIFPEMAEWLKNGRLMPLSGNGKYILIELPLMDIPPYTDNVIFDLTVLGVTPIIAHPERYFKIYNEPELIYKWLESGALFQLNLKSLSGKYGEKTKEASIAMLKAGIYQFIGTDTHRPSANPLPYKQELEILRQHCDDETFRKLTYDNPRAILERYPVSIRLDNKNRYTYKKVRKSPLLKLFKLIQKKR